MRATTSIGPSMRCPLRRGQPCTLCHPDAKSGPADCPTVSLVRDDPDLWDQLQHLR